MVLQRSLDFGLLEPQPRRDTAFRFHFLTWRGFQIEGCHPSLPQNEDLLPLCLRLERGGAGAAACSSRVAAPASLSVLSLTALGS